MHKMKQKFTSQALIKRTKYKKHFTYVKSKTNYNRNITKKINPINT